ncbi:aminotransferase class IV [Euryhalocaulis caribicus]|uniref:aminotransferase class IV n=1 Tax=Euryhalocaulis caribicus TaxID=1161401 RepID=UPI00039F214E|nr:aminotransferase class IV [Euryhalocaulis caribicus]
MDEGSHAYEDDTRNADVKVSVNGEIVHRDKAVVSVFDAGYILGDGVWEGVRLHHGKWVFLDAHLDRLFQGAKAIDMDIGRTRDEIRAALDAVAEANGMTTGVHVRLMITRGRKTALHQSPRFTASPATMVIIPEHKTPSPRLLKEGLRLATVPVRRGYSDVQDPKLNSHSKLNCILAAIAADKAGADEGLMLDPHGFVATCNSTHFFIVTKGEVWTSTGDFCLAGVTRRKILDLCARNGVTAREKNFTLTDVHSADEAFVTGTFGGVVPAREIDGRVIGNGERGPVAKKLQDWYAAYMDEEAGVTRA